MLLLTNSDNLDKESEGTIVASLKPREDRRPQPKRSAMKGSRAKISEEPSQVYLAVKNGRGDEVDQNGEITLAESILEDHQIQPILTQNTKRWLIVGPSESGKSYFTKELLLSSRDNWGEQVFIFSPVEGDKSYSEFFDEEKVVWAELNLEKDPYTLEEFENCTLIFDDIEAIGEPQLRKEINALCDQAFVRGRHLGINTIKIVHELLKGKESGLTLLEADVLVCYPLAGGQKAIRDWMERYLSVSATTINELMERLQDAGGRWTAVYKKVPAVVMTQGSAESLRHLVRAEQQREIEAKGRPRRY